MALENLLLISLHIWHVKFHWLLLVWLYSAGWDTLIFFLLLFAVKMRKSVGTDGEAKLSVQGLLMGVEWLWGMPEVDNRSVRLSDWGSIFQPPGCKNQGSRPRFASCSHYVGTGGEGMAGPLCSTLSTHCPLILLIWLSSLVIGYHLVQSRESQNTLLSHGQ